MHLFDAQNVGNSGLFPTISAQSQSTIDLKGSFKAPFSYIYRVLDFKFVRLDK